MDTFIILFFVVLTLIVVFGAVDIFKQIKQIKDDK